MSSRYFSEPFEVHCSDKEELHDSLLWACIERSCQEFPALEAAVLRHGGDLNSRNVPGKLLQLPLGPTQNPLRYLDPCWKSSRGDLLALERQAASRSDAHLLRRLFRDVFQSLRAGGELLTGVETLEEARGLAEAAIAAGFEVSFLRARPLHDDWYAAEERSQQYRLELLESVEGFRIFEHAGRQGSYFFLLASRRAQRPCLETKRKKRAFVYNCYFDTGGGGERSCLDFAAALDELGYQVDLVSTRQIAVSLEALKSSFGVHERFNWPIRVFRDEAALAEAVKKEGIEVFINHTFSSYMPNPAPIGIYVAMFPTPTLPANIQSLLRYDTICCISEFTAEYVRRFWYDGLRCEVVYPPISHIHQSGDTGSFEKKERIVLQIGRFNVEGHSKCQLEAIQTFVRLREAQILGSNWKMKVIGRVNSGLRNEQYIERCREEIRGADVELITNASLEVIRDLYRRASCLWQFTGFGLDFGRIPQFCEHLGLVAMDCFSYGTIPIIYQRGGMVPLIRHAENGYCFQSQSEIMEIMQQFAAGFGRGRHRMLYRHSKASAERLSFEEYRDSISNMLWRITKTKAAQPSGQHRRIKDDAGRTAQAA